MTRLVLLALLALAPVARADAGPTGGLSASYALEAKEDYAGALKALDAVPGGEVSAYVLALRRGWLLPLMADERWADVESACRKVLAAAPGEPTAQARLAWALLNEGRFHEAAAAYRTALAAWPSDPDLRAGLGWALCRDGERQQAVPLFREALALDAKSTAPATGLATCGRAAP